MTVRIMDQGFVMEEFDIDDAELKRISEIDTQTFEGLPDMLKEAVMLMGYHYEMQQEELRGVTK